MDWIAYLSQMLGVDMEAVLLAILPAMALVEFLKTLPVMPPYITIFGKEIQTGYILAFVLAGGAGGYFQYGLIAPDGIIFLEVLQVVWAGILAFVLSAGLYSLTIGTLKKIAIPQVININGEYIEEVEEEEGFKG